MSLLFTCENLEQLLSLTLPVLFQLFERVLQARLVRFLNEHGVVISRQYGFRTGHCTAMAVLDMVERVRAAWARGNVRLGVFIDLKKAFDTVDHFASKSWSVME